MPVLCLLALGASHSRHHDRCRAAVNGFSFDLSDLAGRTIARRVTVDAKKAVSALLALPMDSGVTIEDLATRVRVQLTRLQGLAAAAGVIVLVVGLACVMFGSEHSCVGPNRGRYDTV